MSYFDKYNKYKSKYYNIKKDMIGGLPIVENKHYEMDKNELLRCESHRLGQHLLENWLKVRTDDGSINKISELFDKDGVYKDTLSATTYNDLYKWTMMPVIRKLESLKNNRITVTFGIDLRDKDMRVALKTNPELVNKIHIALKKLETRLFDLEIFNSILSGNRAAILTKEDIMAICTQDGKIRTLVDKDGVKNIDEQYQRTKEDDLNGKVTITFYYDPTKQYAEGEMGVHFIEATGPWHRVSWLETSMMQCVYEAKLRYDLENHRDLEDKHVPISYYEWLYHALLRCAKSVAYTYLIQREKPSFKPALFTGRRTGGLLFLLLQNLFFADHFNQFNGLNPAESKPQSLSLLKTSIINTSLGTSSVDSWYILQNLDLPCLQPVGTHAHELSMVTSVLYPHIDQNSLHLPLTQIIGHYLYYELVWKKTKGLMAMLPDTLGTRAFMKAANYVTVSTEDGKTQKFIDLIQTARQDSGKLIDFKNNMKNLGYTIDGTTTSPLKSMMASEIDDTHTLLEASELGYASFGAGGFFGDSEKVWGNKKAPSNSMAVKAVRVIYQASPDQDYSSIKYMLPINLDVIGYPVKVGDPSNAADPRLGEGKLSVDKNLPAKKNNTLDHKDNKVSVEGIKEYAEGVRVAAQEPLAPELVGSKPIESFFTIKNGVNYGTVKGGSNNWFNFLFS
jgi:nicotinic acid phosphoribosyltransferase